MDDRIPDLVGRPLPTGGATSEPARLVGVVLLVMSLVVEPFPDKLAIFDVFFPVPGLPLTNVDVLPTFESSLSLLFALARLRFTLDAVAMFEDEVAWLETKVPLRLGVAVTSSLLPDKSFRECPTLFFTAGFDTVFALFTAGVIPAPSATPWRGTEDGVVRPSFVNFPSNFPAVLEVDATPTPPAPPFGSVVVAVFDDEHFALSLLKNLNLSNMELLVLPTVATPGVERDRGAVDDDVLAASETHLTVAIRLTCFSPPTDWLRPLGRVLPPGVGMLEAALLVLLGEAERGMPQGASRGLLPFVPAAERKNGVKHT